MTDAAFARPLLLLLALILPLATGAALYLYLLRRRSAAEALGDPALVRRLAGVELGRFPRRRAALVMGAAAALGIAAAGPRFGAPGARGGAGDTVLVLDASRSMLAADVRPNRLERERALARRVVRSLPAERIGLVAFAGRGFVLSPVTTDASALELYLDAVGPEIATSGGSSLAAAIRQGTYLLLGNRGDARPRSLVVISDGEALEERAAVLQAAARAGQAGIAIHTVGVGTPAGARVPTVDRETGRQTGWTRDPAGRIVVSRLDPELLRAVARASGGRYLELGDAGAAAALLRTLGGDVAAARGAGGTAELPEPWIVLALLLLGADAVLERRAGGRRAALALLLLAAGCDRADRAFQAGDFGRAAELYAARLERGDSSPRLRYNLGTARLLGGEYPAARAALEKAARASHTPVRQAAWYNAGNADLEPAAADTAGGAARRVALRRAAASYKRALLLRPDDADAKWNLEVALRLLERERRAPDQPRQSPQEQGSGGGGGGQSRAAPQPKPGPAGGVGNANLTPAEAARILAGAETAERATQRERLRRDRGGRRALRDW